MYTSIHHLAENVGFCRALERKIQKHQNWTSFLVPWAPPLEAMPDWWQQLLLVASVTLVRSNSGIFSCWNPWNQSLNHLSSRHEHSHRSRAIAEGSSWPQKKVVRIKVSMIYVKFKTLSRNFTKFSRPSYSLASKGTLHSILRGVLTTSPALLQSLERQQHQAAWKIEEDGPIDDKKLKNSTLQIRLYLPYLLFWAMKYVGQTKNVQKKRAHWQRHSKTNNSLGNTWKLNGDGIFRGKPGKKIQPGRQNRPLQLVTIKVSFRLMHMKCWRSSK